VLLSTLPIFRTEISGISAFLKDFVKNNFSLLGRIFFEGISFFVSAGKFKFFLKKFNFTIKINHWRERV